MRRWECGRHQIPQAEYMQPATASSNQQIAELHKGPYLWALRFPAAPCTTA